MADELQELRFSVGEADDCGNCKDPLNMNAPKSHSSRATEQRVPKPHDSNPMAWANGAGGDTTASRFQSRQPRSQGGIASKGWYICASGQPPPSSKGRMLRLADRRRKGEAEADGCSDVLRS